MESGYKHILRKVFKQMLFCSRGLLWIIAEIVLMILSTEFNLTHSDNFLIILLLFLSMPGSIILAFRQIYRDIRKTRNKYSLHIYDSICRDARVDNNEDFPLIVKSPYGAPSKEFIWDEYVDKEVYDIKLHFRRFPDHSDWLAEKFKWAVTKSRMNKAIKCAYKYIDSIRVWKNEKALSINYGEPIYFSDIVSFKIVNEPIIQRGTGSADTITSFGGASINLTRNISINSGTAKSNTTINYAPDQRINQFTLYLHLNNPVSYVISAKIGSSQFRAEEINNYFNNIGIGNRIPQFVTNNIVSNS